MWMQFHACAVKAHGFLLDFDDIFPLQSFQKTLKNSIFTPAIHTDINCMPISMTFRQNPSFTDVFCDIRIAFVNWRLLMLTFPHY